MITASPTPTHVPPAADWRAQMRGAHLGIDELLAQLRLDPDALGVDRDSPFELRVPEAFVARMRRADPEDPLLRQVLPLARERDQVAGYGEDPVGELAQIEQPGLVRKYAGRALLIATAVCAVHCRYCFRRHFPYSDRDRGRADWDRALATIAADRELYEVILSGGDPLSLDDDRLEELVERLDAIPHLRSLRIHTRHPVVLPDRVTRRLCALLRDSRLQCVMVIHANHPAELDDTVALALERLADAGAQLLNQSVLLAGVNDSATTLEQLSWRLLQCRVLPYYLHMLDPVAGSAHFAVDLTTARSLHRTLADRLPGYLVPRLVRETPGAPRKLNVEGDGERF